MTTVERFRRTVRFEPSDRLPLIEAAPWSTRTLSRWYTEGLPRQVDDARELGSLLGLDGHRQLRVFARGATCPPPPPGGGLVAGADDYDALRGHLYPRPRLRTEPALPDLGAWAREQAEGKSLVSLALDGFFWYPRTLLGAERHFHAFYDDPSLLHSMNSDLADYLLWALDQICPVVTPDFAVFTEDLAYDRGAVLSRELFDEFLAPYYRRVLPALAAKGVATFVASDGDVARVADWFEGVGVNGLAPLERRAGVDPLALREKHPRLLLMGGIDCGLLTRCPDETCLQAELERLLPLMRSGGFVPCLDCRAPEQVPLARYRAYVALLAEYCGRACAADPDAAPVAAG